MTDLPPALEDFGRRLQESAEREIVARSCTSRRRWRHARNVGLPVAATFVAAAVGASAVRISDRSGESITWGPAAQGARHAPADPSVVASSATPNPGGGPPWVVRVSTTTSGRECVAVGRLREGVFGQVQNGRFRALPKFGSGTCAPAGVHGPHFALNRRTVDLAVVFGLAVDPSPVTVIYGDRQRQVQPAGLGAFVVVLSGVGRSDPIVVRSKVGGRVVERRLQ